jgi:glucan 1,3-beta-glucosidase
LESSDIFVYGAGLYSFFDNYSTNCSNQGNGEQCQYRIFEVTESSDVTVYNLNTVGTHEMIELNGQNVAYYADNSNGFIDTVALFRT